MRVYINVRLCVTDRESVYQVALGGVCVCCVCVHL